MDNLFESFLKKESIFLNKKILQSNNFPENGIHRENQIKKIAETIAPVLRLEKPSNLFIYGKTGTGKTLSIKYIISKLENISQLQKIPLKFIYINCKLKKIADTEYRLIAQLAREFGKIIPPTGLPTDEIYRLFFESLDLKEQDEEKIVVLILDEIDQLVKKIGDDVLYNLTRINSELKNSQLVLIGISNDLTFMENLDPRVKSSLSEEEITFPPYNAFQLQDILRSRASFAFKKGIMQEGVIEKCAARSAVDHGDARRAIGLLRVSGEIAERKGKNIIEMEDIDEAENKIEKDRVLDAVLMQPKQQQAVIYSILNLHNRKKDLIFTGEAYELYQALCSKCGLRPLTQRRVSDVISELDMMGIINAKVISKGRGGRTREISIALEEKTVAEIKRTIEENLFLL